MNIRIKSVIIAILVSPHIFILVEFLIGIISYRLFLFLSILYLISIPSFVVAVLISNKKV